MTTIKQAQDLLDDLSHNIGITPLSLHIVQKADRDGHTHSSRRDTVFVSQEFLEVLDEEQLKAMLAHGVAHAILSHKRYQAVHFAAVTVVISLPLILAGIPVYYAGLVAMLIAFVLNVRYARQQEYLADTFAASNASRSGLIRALRTMNQLYPNNWRQRVSEYPSSVKRLQALESNT